MVSRRQVVGCALGRVGPKERLLIRNQQVFGLRRAGWELGLGDRSDPRGAAGIEFNRAETSASPI